MLHIKTHLFALAAACAASLCIHTTALAGQSCSDKLLSIESLRLGTNTAINVQRALDASKTQVAMVARVGMDLSEYNIRYTHAGLVYREKPSEPWRIAHLLNGCGTAVSDLWHEGLGNFFLDDLHSYEAILMLPPNADTEQRLLKALNSTNAMRAVHNPAYSMVAYPFSLKYQNSNDWVLETLAIALSTDAQITNRTQAQAWLKLAGYEPSEMRITAGKRLGARMFKANVAFDDHPNELRFADRIQTVTVDSLVNFLEKRQAKWRKTIVAQSAQAATVAAPAKAPQEATGKSDSKLELISKDAGFSLFYDPNTGKLPEAERQARLARDAAFAREAASREATAVKASALTANELLEAKAMGLAMLAQMCMSGFPETRPAILKRFRQDIEKAAGKDMAVKVLNQSFEEGLKQLLSVNEPRTFFFSDPRYWACTGFSLETALADETEKERVESQANERLHYGYEILEQCKKRYPDRSLGATRDLQKEIDAHYGPRAGATAFAGPYAYSNWLKGSVKNSEAMQAEVSQRIKRHGEAGWQARCKPS
jgi:hypothetical protein